MFSYSIHTCICYTLMEYYQHPFLWLHIQVAAGEEDSIGDISTLQDPSVSKEFSQTVLVWSIYCTVILVY